MSEASASSRLAHVRVITPPYFPVKARPVRLFIFLAGILMTIFLPVGFSILQFLSDPVIYEPEPLAHILGLRPIARVAYPKS
jgi:hypothetical protein